MFGLQQAHLRIRLTETANRERTQAGLDPLCRIEAAAWSNLAHRALPRLPRPDAAFTGGEAASPRGRARAKRTARRLQ